MKFGDSHAAPSSAASGSLISRLIAAIGGSAEYAVALALLSVCVIVGAAVWLYRPVETAATPPAVEAPAQGPAAASSSAEQAALKEMKQRMQGDFAQAEKRRRQEQRAAEEEQARVAAKLRRETELARNAAEREKRARGESERPRAAPPAVAVVERPAPARAPELAEEPRIASRQTVALIKPAAPPVAVTLVPASLDWASCALPEYPPQAKRMREQGAVVILFEVDAQGGVTGSRISESSNSESLDRGALRGLGKCRFKPATRNGVAEAASTQVRYVWRLSN